jgi:hypothetical protein
MRIGEQGRDRTMKILHQSLLTLCLALASVNGFAAPEDKQDPAEQQTKFELQLILNLFLKAVESGELTIFEQTLSKDMITPVQIAQVYDLESDTISITIYCRLLEAMKVPHYTEAFYVDGLTAHINADGDIHQITAHIKPY